MSRSELASAACALRRASETLIGVEDFPFDSQMITYTMSVAHERMKAFEELTDAYKQAATALLSPFNNTVCNVEGEKIDLDEYFDLIDDAASDNIHGHVKTGLNALTEEREFAHAS